MPSVVTLCRYNEALCASQCSFSSLHAPGQRYLILLVVIAITTLFKINPPSDHGNYQVSPWIPRWFYIPGSTGRFCQIQPSRRLYLHVLMMRFPLCETTQSLRYDPNLRLYLNALADYMSAYAAWVCSVDNYTHHSKCCSFSTSRSGRIRYLQHMRYCFPVVTNNLSWWTKRATECDGIWDGWI